MNDALLHRYVLPEVDEEHSRNSSAEYLAVAIGVYSSTQTSLQHSIQVTPALFSLHYTVMSVRGAPMPMLTIIWWLKAAVSPLDIHSVNRPNLPVGYGNHHRTAILHKKQSEKGGE